MPIHDDYARFTPYELSIPGRDFAELHFRQIEEEGEARGTDLTDPGALVMLAATGAALREIRGEEDDPALIEQYGVLLYHGFHFWRSGEPLYLLDLGVARFLVEADPDVADWSPSSPSPAGYVQLPRHLFWAHSEGDAPVEPLDGFYWTRSGRKDLMVTAVTGMREDRPGLTVIPLPPLPLEEAATWASTRIREEVGDAAEGPAGAASEDFESILPGGEYERLYSIVSAGEILKLAALVLWYLETFADRSTRETGRTRPADASPSQPDQPTQSDQPDQPSQPDQPDQPDVPGQPDQPDVPAQPDHPDEGVAEAAEADGRGGEAGASGTGPLASALEYRRVTLPEDG